VYKDNDTLLEPASLLSVGGSWLRVTDLLGGALLMAPPEVPEAPAGPSRPAPPTSFEEYQAELLRVDPLRANTESTGTMSGPDPDHRGVEDADVPRDVDLDEPAEDGDGGPAGR
jgi:hypothetical protein